MNYAEKIRKIKEKKEAQKKDIEQAAKNGALEKVLRDTLLKLPESILKKITDKLDTIESNAAADQTSEEIIKLLKNEGIDFANLSTISHKHDEFNKYAEIEIFNKFKTEIADQGDKLAKNLIESDKKLKDINAEITKKAEKEDIAVLAEKNARIEKIIKAIRHSDLIGLKWSEAGHKIDIDFNINGNKIVNLKRPEKLDEAANKEYVDEVAQRAAGMARGGGGAYIGKTPPSNPAVNTLWIDTS